MFRRYLSRLPLTDRITFSYEIWAGVFYGAFNGLALPLIPIVARRMGMGPAGIAAMLTMQFVGAIFGLFLGHMADRRGKMPFVVWPALVSRSFIALLIFPRSPSGFMVIASVFYLASNLGGPAYASIMRSNYSDANRGRLMGDIRVILMAVSAVCSTAASLALSADMRAVRLLFPAAAVFGVASTLAFSRIKVRRFPVVLPVPVSPSFFGSFRVVLRNSRFLIFMAIFFLCTTPDKLAIPLEPIRLVDELGVNYESASMLLGTVVSVFGIIGYYIWGRALKRVNPYYLLFCLVVLFAIRFLLIALARTTLDLIPMSVVTGLTNAGWDLIPLFCIIPLADPANFSLYFGVHTTLLGIRGLAGPWIGALIYGSGALTLVRIFLLIFALTLAGAVLLIPFTRSLTARARSHIFPKI
jgi:hypothetical protein